MIKRFLLCALSATVLFSCSKQDDNGNDPVTPEPDTVVLTATPEAIVLSSDKASEKALTLSWAGGTESYDLYLNVESKDIFTAPYMVEGVSGSSVSFTHSELNAIVLELGAVPGRPEGFQAILYSQGTQSEKAKFSITAYEKPFEGPAHLYILGNATPYKWTMADTPAISPKTGDPMVFEIKDIPLKVKTPGARSGFKLYFSNDSSDPRVATQDPAANEFGTIKIYDTDPQNEFFPNEFGFDNGVYDISVDLNTMKLQMTKKGDLPEEQLPDKLYMLGGCFTWSWEFTGTTLDKISENIYKASNITMDFGGEGGNGFKIFLGVNEWSPYYAMDDSSVNGNIKVIKVTDNDVPQFYPGKIGYEKGIYDIEVNFNSMIMTLSKVADVSSDPNEGAMWMNGPAVGGWDMNQVVIPKKNDNEWEKNGVALDMEADWPAIQIYKSFNQWWPMYLMSTSDKTNMTLVEIADDADKSKKEGEGSVAAFTPKDFGYTTGTYTVNINISTMRLTLTKEN